MMNLTAKKAFASLIGSIAILTLVTACSEPATTSDPTTLSSVTYASAPGDDAPELAQLGQYRIGVKTLSFTYKNQADIALLDFVGGDAPVVDRTLSVDVIYPANVAEGTEADALYQGRFANHEDIEGLPKHFDIRGLAVRDATPVTGERFPLVIVSHGFLNTAGVLSGLTENLATKGYVVVAIDHDDFGQESDTPVHIFARVMLNRSLDQQRIVKEFVQLAQDSSSAIGAIIDPEAIGIAGFSMGGYGVLNHAGAGYNPEGSAYSYVPGELLKSQSEANASYDAIDRDYIDAAITFAPWGAQPEANMWTDKALANIKAPLLVLGGSMDDVSMFDTGIRRVFEKATGSNRHMLVYQNALHNIVQVPAPLAAHLDVVPWQNFEDPTWRREKLLSVGAHFMTAFFDWHLKGDLSKESYFNVPTRLSNDGSWEKSMLSDPSDQYANGEDGSENYWKGFKPRQALGLELHSLNESERPE